MLAVDLNVIAVYTDLLRGHNGGMNVGVVTAVSRRAAYQKRIGRQTCPVLHRLFRRSAQHLQYNARVFN